MHPIRFRGHRREIPLSATKLSVAEEVGTYAARLDDQPRRQIQPPAAMIDSPSAQSVRFVHPPVTRIPSPSRHHPLPR